MTCIFIVDDHPLVREALRTVALEVEPGAAIDEFADGASFLGAIKASHPGDVDLVLLDLGLPGWDGLALLGEVCALRPEVCVVVVTASDSPESAQRAMKAGASGFIPKASHRAAMCDALREVLAGGRCCPGYVDQGDPRVVAASAPAGLTDRQLEVLRMVAEGRSNREIAEALDLTENTIKVHMTAVLRELEAENRTHAVAVARARGLLGRMRLE